MADADCGTCEALGYRSCDLCGNPVMDHWVHPLGAAIDLCPACR